MARAYSDDLRAKLLQAYENGNVGLEKLSATFGVSYGWSQKILAAKLKTGSTERPLGRPRGYPSRFTPEIREKIRERIVQGPDATLAELQAWILEVFNFSTSVSRICTVLGEMGLDRKKKSARF